MMFSLIVLLRLEGRKEVFTGDVTTLYLWHDNQIFVDLYRKVIMIWT